MANTDNTTNGNNDGMKVSKVGNHVEVLRPENSIQIEFRDDGKVLWVNVDGQCMLRISQIPTDPDFQIALMYPAGWDHNLIEAGSLDSVESSANSGKAAQVGGGKTVERPSHENKRA